MKPGALGQIKSPLFPEDVQSPESCLVDDDTDTMAIAEEQAANEDAKDKHRATEEFIKDAQQDREQRKIYARELLFLMCGWLFLVLAFVAFAGIGWLKLSDAVLIALISGVSINIIGLVAIVTNYLFPKQGRNHSSYHSGQ